MSNKKSTSKNILVGICGGVAAYKAVEVVSALRQAKHRVQVTMSDAAREFVTPLTFSAVSGNPVLTSLFPSKSPHTLEETYPHLFPSTEADIFLLIPATANKMAQCVHGLASDIISASVLSLPSHCLKVFCPAMNVEMWEQEKVQENATKLEEMGWVRIGPESGHLACGSVGVGRLADPSIVLENMRQLIKSQCLLSGKKVMILSGPTREYLDPVRFIGNASSGKMGKALALSALHCGAEVEFVTGPVDTQFKPNSKLLSIHEITSADEMLETAEKISRDSDIMIFAAAVADYTPSERHTKKAPKSSGGLTLSLRNTPDIAGQLGAVKKDEQISIGFALQSHNGLEEARKKLRQKNFDAIVLNYVEAMESNQGTYQFITGPEDKDVKPWGKLEKSTCALRIIKESALMMG